MKRQTKILILHINIFLYTLSMVADSMQTKNNVYIRTKSFYNPNNKMVTLTGVAFNNNQHLLAKDFTDQELYPCNITIANTTNKPLILGKKSINNMPFATTDTIKEKLHYSTLKPILYFIGSKIISEISNSLLPNKKNDNMGLILIDIASYITMPGYIWYLHTLNQAIDSALDTYFLETNVVIMPGETVEKLLVFKYRPSNIFTLNLFKLSGEIAESISVALN